jgi:hypothetical protein
MESRSPFLAEVRLCRLAARRPGSCERGMSAGKAGQGQDAVAARNLNRPVRYRAKHRKSHGGGWRIHGSVVAAAVTTPARYQADCQRKRSHWHCQLRGKTAYVSHRCSFLHHCGIVVRYRVFRWVKEGSNGERTARNRALAFVHAVAMAAAFDAEVRICLEGLDKVRLVDLEALMRDEVANFVAWTSVTTCARMGATRPRTSTPRMARDVAGKMRAKGSPWHAKRLSVRGAGCGVPGSC